VYQPIKKNNVPGPSDYDIIKSISKTKLRKSVENKFEQAKRKTYMGK